MGQSFKGDTGSHSGGGAPEISGTNRPAFQRHCQSPLLEHWEPSGHSFWEVVVSHVFEKKSSPLMEGDSSSLTA